MTMKLLTENNPKALKSEALGYATAILHLAPYDLSGTNVCPFAKQAKCFEGCLNTAGRGQMTSIQQSRIRKTRLFVDHREEFFALLRSDIEAFLRRCDRRGLTPSVRLNGTSDILWENESVGFKPNIFEHFRDVQFYDYTKVAKRLERELPFNYHLSLSYSEANLSYARQVWKTHAKTNCNVVVVVRNDEVKQQWLDAPVFHTVDGDKSDLRFLESGAIVVLRAKGRAKHDASGFVLDGFAKATN